MRKRGLYLVGLLTFIFILLWYLRPLLTQEMDYEQFFQYKKAQHWNRPIPWWYDTLSQKVQGWDTVITEHYAVHTNIDLKKTYWIASLVERMVKVYTDIFEKEFGLPPVVEYLCPGTVRVFSSKKSYHKYRQTFSDLPSSISAFHCPKFQEVVLCEEAKKLQGRIFHECFHHFLRSYLDLHSKVKVPPKWLNEGLAEYFETMTLDKKGRPILGSKSAWLPSLKKKIKKGQLKSLKKIISEHKKFDRDESWGIAHFLMHSRGGKRRPLIGDYIKKLMQGQDHIKAFEEVFGSDYSSLEKEWKEYFLSLRR